MAEPYSITIPAKVGNKVGKFPVVVSGRFFLCVSATAAFEVQRDFSGRVPANTSTNFGQTDKPFKLLVFYNTSGAAIDVIFVASDEPITAQPSISLNPSQTIYVKDAPTTPVASSAPVAAITTYSGVNAGRTRKQFAVFNAEALGGQNISLRDGGGNVFTVTPQEKVSFYSSGVFKVSVPAAAAVGAEIMETFYDA